MCPTFTKVANFGTSAWSIPTIAGRRTGIFGRDYWKRSAPSRWPISSSGGRMAARSSLLHDGCSNGGGLIRICSPRPITSLSKLQGKGARHLCAFARNRGGASLIVAVPRLVYALCRGVTTADWGAAEIALPALGAWRDVFTGRSLVLQERVQVSDLLAEFPVCVLFGEPLAAGTRGNRDRSSLSAQSDVVMPAILPA